MLHRFRWFVTAFSMVLALVPFTGPAVAALIALAAGCEINDAAPIACSAFGADLGPLLSTLAGTARFGEMTFSILVPVLMLWVLVESAALLFRRLS